MKIGLSHTSNMDNGFLGSPLFIRPNNKLGKLA